MSEQLANLLFPNITQTLSQIIAKYPKRKEQYITRLAPSPTWFLHLWAIFTALIDDRLAHMNWWKMFLRIEDTDKKREVEWAVDQILQAFLKFWIKLDEWPIGPNNKDVWDYWPYTQSHRVDIYQTFVKDMVMKWIAYPCFMTEEELQGIRDNQQKQKIAPWIYGKFSIWREKSIEEIHAELDKGTDYVIRFKSPWTLNNRIKVYDELRWEMEVNENYVDIVLLKSDRIPTYHLAHVVDDFLMWTTHVIRAEERLPSLPLHLQMYNMIWLNAPKYIHIAQLLKIDKGNKRKLSKRHDPEANVEYFYENGYLVYSVIDYLFNIMDSSYEEWRLANPKSMYKDFHFDFRRLPLSGALLDLTKLDSISNQYLSRITTQELYDAWLHWAESYDIELAWYMKKYPDLTYSALNIERHTDQDPKRFTKLSDIRSQLLPFYDETYNELINNRPLIPENIDKQTYYKILDFYIENYDPSMNKDDWFAQMKWFAWANGFALNNQEFKTWNYIWKVWDIAMILRIILCWSKQTPDLHSVMQVLSVDKVKERLLKAKSL